MAPHSETDRPRLSVAMIVRNEQDVLPTTLESARPIADEILVLDTGSTDQTATLAEQRGALVSRTLWNEDFSDARNRLMARAAGEWVLWLDAGERLAPESASQLRAFIDGRPDPRTVYLVMVEAPAADPASSNEQAAKPRLLPNLGELRFAGRVRETLVPSIEAAGLKVELAPGRIHRHPRLHDPERKARNALRDLKLIALDAIETGGPDPRLLVALGEACADLDDQATARRAFFEAARHATRGSTEMLEAYYGLLASFDGTPPQTERQVALCLEALEIYPLDAQLLCAMGSYLQAQNRLDLAARSFQTAVRYGKVDAKTWHLCEIGQMASAFLALTLQMQGNDDEARRVLREASTRWQDSARIRRRLVDLCLAQGRDDEALRVADAWPIDHREREALRHAIEGAAKAARKDWLPALGLLQSAHAAGCREPFCLKWLAVTLLSNGQIEAARPVLDEWLQLEPNSAELWAYREAVDGQPRAAEPAAALPAAGQCQVIDTSEAVDLDTERYFRVDSGMTVAVASPPRMPIVHQALSTDPAGKDSPRP
jgi:tetratricopeptide (TPR) repeat protein